MTRKSTGGMNQSKGKNTVVLDFPGKRMSNATKQESQLQNTSLQSPQLQNVQVQNRHSTGVVQKVGIASLNVVKGNSQTSNGQQIFTGASQGPVYKIKKSQIINHADIKNFDLTKKNIQNGQNQQIKEISNFTQRKDSVTFKSKLSRLPTG